MVLLHLVMSYLVDTPGMHVFFLKGNEGAAALGEKESEGGCFPLSVATLGPLGGFSIGFCPCQLLNFVIGRTGDTHNLMSIQRKQQ